MDERTEPREVDVDQSVASDTPWVLIAHLGGRRQMFNLRHSTTTVGRGIDTDIQIDHASLSRQHAQLQRKPDGGLQIVDLDSTNGTFLNGVKVRRAQVHPGDELHLGPDLVMSLALGPGGRRHQPPPPTTSHRNMLTLRQLEVAQLVAEGLTSTEIAERMNIKVRTVTSHLDHIYTRLNINSRAALARWVTETRRAASPTAKTATSLVHGGGEVGQHITRTVGDTTGF